MANLTLRMADRGHGKGGFGYGWTGLLGSLRVGACELVAISEVRLRWPCRGRPLLGAQPAKIRVPIASCRPPPVPQGHTPPARKAPQVALHSPPPHGPGCRAVGWVVTHGQASGLVGRAGGNSPHVQPEESDPPLRDPRGGRCASSAGILPSIHGGVLPPPVAARGGFAACYQPGRGRHSPPPVSLALRLRHGLDAARA